MTARTKPRPITEAQWQEQVVDLAHIHGWIVAHFRPAQTAKGWRTAVSYDGKGFFDLVLARRGVVIFAELKTQRGTLTDDQRKWFNEVTGSYIWRPNDLEAVKGLLR